MRNFPIQLIIGLFIVITIAFLSLLLFQSAWLKMIMHMVDSNQSTGLPVASTPITGFSFPTAGVPAPVGTELVVGNLGITVTRVISPANSYIGKAGFSSVPREGKEFLVVDVKARCVSSNEKCHLTEFDFGLETKSGRDYSAELSGNFSGILKGVFEGGDIEPGKSLNGSLIFIIQKGESGLTLVYPRMYGFGNTVKFKLGK